MGRTFVDALAVIFETASGAPPPPGFDAAVFAALEPSGMPDESCLPTYFVAGFRQLAGRARTVGLADVPSAEIGLSWVLRELVPVIPGALFREQPGRDAFAVPALGLAFAVETSTVLDRWGVVVDALDQPAALRGSPGGVGGFGPNGALIEQWARDPAARLSLEDEHLALEDDRHVGILAALAADPTTVKRAAILAALDQLAMVGLWRDGAAGLARIDEILAAIDRSGAAVPEDMRTWAAALRRVRGYAGATGPVGHDEASVLAGDLLVGRRHPAALITGRDVGGWWEFAASAAGAPPHEHLYVDPRTGALRWSPVTLDASQLVVPPSRLAALGPQRGRSASMSSAFISLVGELLGKVTGAPGDDATLTRAAAALGDVGMSDDPYIPSYFHDAVRRVIAGGTLPWVTLPGGEQGVGWALGKLVDVVPGAWFDEQADRDVFGVPALGRAIVVERSGSGDRYAVVELHPSGRPLDPPARTRPTVLGTLVPTEDQLRRWAYDPDLRLASQDEEDALEAAPPALMVELARDRQGPKRDRIRGAILSNGLRRVLTEGARARPVIDEVARVLRTSGDPELFEDGTAVVALAAYLDGSGPVDLDAARRIARLLLVGVAAVEIDVREVGGWWEMSVRDRPPYELLYVQPSTGALAFRRGGALDAAALAQLGTPATRVAALGGGAFGG